MNEHIKNRKYVIYKATNVINGYVYIGQTERSMKQRRYQHLSSSRKDNPKYKFHQALKEYGIDNFVWSVIDEIETANPCDADKLEMFYVSQYKSNILGYNNTAGGGRPSPGSTSGKKNGRYGDHRTWEEIHGKERADQLRQIQINNLTGHEGLREAMKKRLSVWNPMDDPTSREKVRQSKLGVKNPNTKYNYYLTDDSGNTITIECLREFCRNNPTYHRSSIMRLANTDKKYKNMSIKKELKDGR